MTTNTYRLAVALQAKAIDSIDLHAGGSTPQPTPSATTSPSSRATAPVQTSASCRCGHATPTRTCSDRLKQALPPGGGAHRQPRHRIPRRSSALGTPHHPHRRAVPQPRRARHRPAHPSQAQIGFHACGRADYYLSHDWAPGRSPRDTTWSLLVGTTHTGLVVARTKVDVDTAISYAAELETRHLAAV